MQFWLAVSHNELVEFEQIAVVPVDNRICVILRPIAPIEGLGADEALVFSIEEIDGEECLVIVEDDDIIDVVFEEYYEMLREQGVID